MAIRRVVTEKELTPDELTTLIKNYWASGPNGFVLDSAMPAVFELSMISDWLELKKDVIATNEEIFEATKKLVAELAKTLPSSVKLEIEYAGMDFPTKFKIYYQITLLPPLTTDS